MTTRPGAEAIGGVRASSTNLDSQSAAFVDAIRVGLNGHPARMQQLLKRALRYPPTALRTNPALLEGLHQAVSMITKPTEAAVISQDNTHRQHPQRGADIAALDPASISDVLVQDSITAAEPILNPEAHRAISAVVEEHRSQSLKDLGIAPTRTMLLTGDPGTGKTLSARWLARQLGAPLLRLDLAAVMNKQLGRSSQNLVAAIESAAETDAVLFVDEFDAIASARASSTDIGEIRRMVNVLLIALERWPENHLLIAATNHPQLLDAAVHRRFEVTVHLDKPAPRQREQMWLNACDTLSHTDAARLAVLSPQWSGSDIATCALRARRAAGLHGRRPTIDDVLPLLEFEGYGRPHQTVTATSEDRETQVPPPAHTLSGDGAAGAPESSIPAQQHETTPAKGPLTGAVEPTSIQTDRRYAVSSSNDLQTWTVVGHWENSRIQVEYVVDGDYEDPRIDTGYWEEGLFAASGQGRTAEEVIAAVRQQYETPLHA